MGQRMAASFRKTLAFCEPFYRIEYLEGVSDLAIAERQIVFNLNDHPIRICAAGETRDPMDVLLPSRRSSVFSSFVLEQADRLLCIQLAGSDTLYGSHPRSSPIRARWMHASTLFSFGNSKGPDLWRSDKERLGNTSFNLWFASAHTNCGIHQEHGFRELHTQIFGLGRMQMFRTNTNESLFQEVFMCPGHTHDPFYDANCRYPWHQYYADTECVWLAIEFHKE